jgi:hypothetical protein
VTDTDARLRLLRIAISVAYICGILISLRLWFGLERTYPRVPLVNGMPFSSSAELLLSVVLLAALTATVISRSPRYLVAVVILTALLVVFDLTRLQPWVYQYVLMLAVLAFLKPTRTNQDDEKAAAQVFAAGQLIVAFLYFWSGVQKLNWTFGHEVVPGLLEWTGIHLPTVFLSYLPAMGIAVALCEMLIGVGLLIPKTRQAAVVLALGTHLLVLLMLVVSRRNSVVWPWNVAMMITVVLLFWRFDRSLVRRELWRWRGASLVSHLPKAVIVICGIAPALSFAGWWDLYLSGALYSGNTPVAVVRVSDHVRDQLSAVAQQQMFKTSRGELMLPLHEWSMAELNVPPYPEVRAYRQLTRRLCSYADDSREIELIVKGRPSLIDGSYSISRFGCKD